MSGSRRWLPAAALVVLLITLGLVFGASAPPIPSIHSRAPEGLSVLAAYLTRRGHPVSEVGPVEDALADPTEGLIVVAFPTARSWTSEDAMRLRTWVRRGGHLVLLTSATSALPPELADTLELGVIRRDPPTGWGDWQEDWEFSSKLESEQGELVITPSEHAVTCRAGAVTEVFDAAGRPAVCAQREGRGVLTVINNTSLLQNDRLGLAHNLDFLEAMLLASPTTDPARPEPAPVRFWEHHHGPGTPTGAGPAVRLELILAQLAALYLLMMHQRARPLGPPRPGLTDREPGLVAELRTLGQLHAAGKHGIEAARRLLAQARRRRPGDERVAALPETVHTLPEALSVGQRLAEIEQNHA